MIRSIRLVGQINFEKEFAHEYGIYVEKMLEIAFAGDGFALEPGSLVLFESESPQILVELVSKFDNNARSIPVAHIHLYFWVAV